MLELRALIGCQLNAEAECDDEFVRDYGGEEDHDLRCGVLNADCQAFKQRMDRQGSQHANNSGERLSAGLQVVRVTNPRVNVLVFDIMSVLVRNARCIRVIFRIFRCSVRRVAVLSRMQDRLGLAVIM